MSITVELGMWLRLFDDYCEFFAILAILQGVDCPLGICEYLPEDCQNKSKDPVE